MCGIAGAYGVDNAAFAVSLMLRRLQDRGREAAGIVSSDGSHLHEARGFGRVGEVFAGVDFGACLPGRAAIGHVRYSTTGDSGRRENIQPLSANLRGGRIAIAHNGNLTNYAPEKLRLAGEGAIFASNSDTEILLHLLNRADGGSESARLARVFASVDGAYSLLILSAQKMHAAMDPFGFRPLVMAKYDDGFLVASETRAFDVFARLDAEHVQNGEIITFADTGLTRRLFASPPFRRHCSFEHIYFSRPDSIVFGVSANEVRKKLGAALARKNAIRTDMVIAVPDSSNAMALAYADEAHLRFEFALIRDHETGRTFIEPRQASRELGVKMKFNVVAEAVHGKTVTMVDDSVVRGTTSRRVAKILREAGAREVHLRVASPPVISPCYWGIDTPNRQDLIAAAVPREMLAAHLGLDSLDYLTVEELRAALGDVAGNEYCASCFTGCWPVPLQLLPTEQQTSDKPT